MPLRDYLCPACGQLQEHLIRHDEDEAELRCEKCGAGQLEQQLSAPARYGGACDTGG
jgi:putative FmdB family regulatory protein